MATSTAEVPAVRHAVKEHLTSLHVTEEVVETVALLVSELVTNAITHAAPPIRCAAYLTSRAGSSLIRVEVCDASHAPPVLREEVLESESGRGLHLVEKLSSRWGWHPTEQGKCTFFEVDAPI
jgi:anti-sigma regulatory factor (Ser/Thr protein kinase)